MALNKIKVNDTTTVNTGVVYDITKVTGQSYTVLKAALGTNGNNVPLEIREGGMTIRFVLTSDNKYVQYRLISTSFSTNEADWQGVDDNPTAESDNLVKSGGVFSSISAEIARATAAEEANADNLNKKVGSEEDKNNIERTECNEYQTVHCVSKQGKAHFISIKSKSIGKQVESVEDFDTTNSYYIIREDIDLKNKTLIIPKGSCIDFKGGSLYNGCVFFNNTLLLGDIKCYTDICGTISNNNISINWFEDLSGETPDISDVLQKTIEFVADMTTEFMVYKPNLVYIEAGEYTMTKTVNIRAFAKLRTSGFVKIVTKISDAPMFVLCPSSKDLKATFIGNAEYGFNLPYKTNAYLNGKWIDGSNGLLLECESFDLNSTAIAIGADSSVTTDAGPCICSKFSVEFITIHGFSKGIVLHGYHNYINGYVNLNMQYNIINISQENATFKDSSFQGNVNYDENIKFTNCIFGGVRTTDGRISKMISCNINCSLHFQNCSLDYMRYVAFDNTYIDRQDEVFDFLSTHEYVTLYGLKVEFGDDIADSVSEMIKSKKLILVDNMYYTIGELSPTLRLHINNCHIEGVGDGSTDETGEEGMYGFFSKGFSKDSAVSIIQSRIVLISTRNHYMIFNNRNVNVIMNANIMNATQNYNGHLVSGYDFLSSKYVDCSQLFRAKMYIGSKKYKVCQASALSPYNNILVNGFMNNAEDAIISSDSLIEGCNIGSFYVKNTNPEIPYTIECGGDVYTPFAKYGGKAIKLTIPEPTEDIPDEGLRKQIKLHIESPYFKIEDLKEYFFNYGSYHHSDLKSLAQEGASRFRVSAKIELYNEDNTLVETIDTISDNTVKDFVFPSIIDLDYECWPPCLNGFKVPSTEATKAKLILDFHTLIWNAGEFRFTGLYIEKN